MQERARFEADALREQARLCPEHVPELFHFDAQLCLIVMQYLPPPHDVARRALTAGKIYPKLAQHLATFMARTLFGTSLFALDAKTWRWGSSAIHEDWLALCPRFGHCLAASWRRCTTQIV